MTKEIEPTENAVYNKIRQALIHAKQKVCVEAYWDIGRQIMEAQVSNSKAEYGGLIKYLKERIATEFGKGFTETNLKYMRQFYAVFPNHHALRDQLSWTHYRLLNVPMEEELKKKLERERRLIEEKMKENTNA